MKPNQNQAEQKMENVFGKQAKPKKNGIRFSSKKFESNFFVYDRPLI